MTDTTTTEPRRSRRPARSRRPLNLRRRRRNRAVRPPLAASEALARLAVRGDVFRVGRTPYFVAPIDVDLLDTVIAALGATEDDEDADPGGTGGAGYRAFATDDDEPSLGGGYCPTPDLTDLELDDGERGEDTLGWQNEGSQARLQHNLPGDNYEGDGECDDEDGDPDHGIDDVKHDGDNGDSEPSLCGVDMSAMLSSDSDVEGEAYQLDERDARYHAEAQRRVKAAPPDDGSYGARKVVLAMMRRRGPRRPD